MTASYMFELAHLCIKHLTLQDTLFTRLLKHGLDACFTDKKLYNALKYAL